MYYEADCTIERKKGETCTPFNNVALSFDHRPSSWYEVKDELAKRYPRFNLIEVRRVWDASGKAKELSDYYNNGQQFHGD